MHDLVPQLYLLDNEPSARRQQQLWIHVHPMGGPAIRQAGVFYRVSSGSRKARGQILTSRLARPSQSGFTPPHCPHKLARDSLHDF